MCPLAGKPLPAATLDALLAPVLRGEHALEPVSYTHLDVYKRQVTAKVGWTYSPCWRK